MNGKPSKLTTRNRKMVRMRAEGASQQRIANETGVSRTLVRDYLAKPEAQDALTAARSRVRSIVMKRADRLVSGTLDVVQHSIDARDAKSLDASARAALSLEKLTQSASGESAKVEVSGQVNVDVRALLAKYAAS